ncbi:hypothetical protein Tco_1083402 [Tanacetum coccineum]
MAEENVLAQAPTRTDEQILPHSAWLKIGKSNLLLDLQKMQKNPIFHISVDILRNTNLFRAFTASANFSLSVDLLYKALEITPVDPAHLFVSPPAGEAVMDFVNELGDKPIHPILQMLWGIVTRTNVDHVELLWEEFVQGIQTFFSHKDSTKKTTPHVIPYCRFTNLIIYYLGSGHNIHRRPESAVHITDDDFPLGNLKFIPKGEKDEVFGMPIPKHLITKVIQQSSYYQQYLDMVARKPNPKEGGKKKTVFDVEKPKKPATVKQTKPTPIVTAKTITTSTTLALPPPPPRHSSTGPELATRVYALEKRNAELEQVFTIQNKTTKNLTSRIFTLEHRDLEFKIDNYVRETMKENVQIALRAPRLQSFRDMSEIEIKEILHQRMFESGSYKTHSEHADLYDALDRSMARDNMDEFLAEKAKSRKRRHDDQDPPQPPPKESDQSKKKRHDTDACASRQHPPQTSSA